MALRHSRGVGPAVRREALRGQTPASSVGRRQPEPPVVVEHAVCPCSSGVPSLTLPVLGCGDTSMDNSPSPSSSGSLSRRRLSRTGGRARRRRRRRNSRGRRRSGRSSKSGCRGSTPSSFDDPCRRAAASSSSSSSMRKRKKKRKNKLPRTSSFLRSGRTWKSGHFLHEPLPSQSLFGICVWFTADASVLEVSLPEEYTDLDSSGVRTPELFQYSGLGSTVDTCCYVGPRCQRGYYVYTPLYPAVTCSSRCAGILGDDFICFRISRTACFTLTFLG